MSEDRQAIMRTLWLLTEMERQDRPGLRRYHIARRVLVEKLLAPLVRGKAVA